MTCEDFERIWGEILDARGADAGHPEIGEHAPDPGPDGRDRLRSARRHALDCDACRPRMLQFETLRRAIRSWEDAPRESPSADLTDRILAAVAGEDSGRIPRRGRRLWKRVWVSGMAAGAAAAALMLALSPRHDRRGPGAPIAAPAPGRPIARIDAESPRPPVDLLALNQALSEATDATWDLAYAASAPAVRIGRTVFVPADGGPGMGTGEPVAKSSEGRSLAEAPGEVVSEVLNAFGAGISAEVRPLSDSARRAIELLRGAVPATSPPGGAETPPPPPDPRGA